VGVPDMGDYVLNYGNEGLKRQCEEKYEAILRQPLNLKEEALTSVSDASIFQEKVCSLSGNVNGTIAGAIAGICGALLFPSLCIAMALSSLFLHRKKRASYHLGKSTK